ncbi:MAG: hypothetical protein OQK51_00005 [Kangiellaceae bacterium]|nr:hypothetical protein [Kangiellaceae bacterium]
MSNSEVNGKVVNTIESLQQSTLTGTLIKHSGAGKAYQSVSQSSAIAIQDATDNLRNVSTMSTTAMGVAISQMLATGEVDKYAPIIQQASEMVKSSAEAFQLIGSNASKLLEDFPTGD